MALVSAREPSNLSFAELPASALSLTSKQTALFQETMRKYFTCDTSLRDGEPKNFLLANFRA